VGHSVAHLSRFQAGGALHEASLYIERSADAELHEALSLGGLSLLIAPHQMGKSSLRRRAERRQRALGVRCVSVDLAVIGARGVTEASWRYAFALLIDLDRLACTHERVTVFIDELDVALGLPFPPDAFFASLEAAASPSVAVCLIGVTEPDRWSAGRARVIRPGPFTLKEARAFLPGLAATGGDTEALLSAVLARTGGHPYLTQRLCELLVLAGAEDAGSPEDRVARAVNDGLLDDPAVKALRPR
jgi:hypothetical protein